MTAALANGIVLLVDDDPKMNHVSRNVLTRETNYIVYEADSLTQARKLLTEIKLDVILLNVEINDDSGIDFCQEIRDKTNAAIIFVTGEKKREYKLRGAAVGCDDYITAPFDINDYLSRIEAARKRRKPPHS